ncbi:MAG: hypothetical protein JNJ60_18645, partial [Rhodocyclaceae bacterium]|nr:hypothetical protein [Rhodocyclaceae bacterium]
MKFVTLAPGRGPAGTARGSAQADVREGRGSDCRNLLTYHLSPIGDSGRPVVLGLRPMSRPVVRPLAACPQVWLRCLIALFLLHFLHSAHAAVFVLGGKSGSRPL